MKVVEGRNPSQDIVTGVIKGNKILAFKILKGTILTPLIKVENVSDDGGFLLNDCW